MDLTHWKQRLALSALLVICGAVEARFIYTSLTPLFQQVPRIPGVIDPENLALGQVKEFATHGGIKEGDTLLAVNGVPIHSGFDAAHEFFARPGGTHVQFTVRTGDGPPRTVDLVTPIQTMTELGDFAFTLGLNIILPVLCIGLGFLVAFRRPSDPTALAILWLLLSLAFMQRSNGYERYSWGVWMSGTAILLDVFSNAWPAAWCAVALLFPDGRWRRGPLSWISLAAIVIYTPHDAARAALVAGMFAEPKVWAILRPLEHLPKALTQSWHFALIGLGLLCFLVKFRAETHPAARRRMRWMLAGLMLGILPNTALMVSAVLLNRDLNDYPIWLLMPGVLAPILIPVTLAYSMLVDRLFDLGVVFRQGLLASRTVTALRLLVNAILLWVAFSGRGWIVTLLCLAGIMVVSYGTDHVRAWVDRRFFREAVNTEQVLIELSNQVRRITDPKKLLEIVQDRIQAALHITRIELLPAGGYQDFGDLILPLTTPDQDYGALRLGPKLSEEPYSRRDLQLLESVASQTALALDVSRLTATVATETAQRERLNNELEIASQVQQRLFPKRAPQIQGLDLAGCCVPAQSVGGDYYDFLTTPGGAVGLAIGDVAGKGVPAALLMAGLQASLRGLILGGVTDLRELMAKLNVLVYDASPANRFATFFYGVYEPAGGALRYSCAGHNPSLLLRATGEHHWLKTPGVGLGMTRRAQYEQAEAALQPGDMLVLYTDGVTEARNPQGEEFGEDRLLDALRAAPGAGAQAAADQLLEALTRFAAGAPQHDDITLIVARRSA
ncbi:SpoIIE family protein phosphatase [Paludibaculum fermentans]|uniref:SpoIIE family protein phosphatase n=1 Tax=Paludibaculum fermentans TaxID=1473598 RepID=A0A7S7NR52_PALFE|nr:SpoIIE family protein phosphatase [Paludibaculum fermentans]QOY88257.1 SpoIIE family protein phosphatase [Paludibaculum fermentans]